MEAADLAAAEDLFGSNIDLDAMQPRSAKEFEDFAAALAAKYLSPHAKSAHVKAVRLYLMLAPWAQCFVLWAQCSVSWSPKFHPRMHLQGHRGVAQPSTQLQHFDPGSLHGGLCRKVSSCHKCCL